MKISKFMLKIIVTVFVVIFGFVLRYYRFENHVPFEWDQSRDYQEVTKIANGHPTLLGPVAKGSGGFFLGPLYYYLILPIYIIKSGDPLSLPLTSIIIDVATIAAIAFLFSKKIGFKKSIIISFCWSISWFLISWSRVSWNVTLVNIWTLATMTALYDYIYSKDERNLLTLGLLAGLSWHIHASLIPIIPMILFITIIMSKKLNCNLKIICFAIIMYIIPILPLIIFDIRHDFLNLGLISKYFALDKPSISQPLLAIINDVISKIGKNTLALYTGYSARSLISGLGLITMSIYSIFKLDLMSKIAAVIIIINIILCISLKDLGFPEYYFAVSYLPSLVIFINLIFNMKIKYNVALLFIWIFTYLNLSKYSLIPSLYAYNQKILIVDKIAQLNSPVDIRYELSFGREGGFAQLLTQKKVEVQEGAKTQIILTDQLDQPVVSAGVTTSELIRAGGIKAAMLMLE